MLSMRRICRGLLLTGLFLGGGAALHAEEVFSVQIQMTGAQEQSLEFGIDTDATDSYDSLDKLFPPPSPGGGAEVLFLIPGLGRAKTDYRSESDPQEWPMSVSIPGTTKPTLSWEVPTSPYLEGKRLQLQGPGTFVDMLSQTSVELSRSGDYSIVLLSSLAGAAVPLSPSGSLGDESRPEFRWSAVQGATWYQLYIRKLGAGGWDWGEIWVEAETSWIPEYQDSSYDLPVGDFLWWVQPWSEGTGAGAWSGTMSFRVGPDSLSAPQLTSPSGTVSDTNRPEFVWGAVGGGTWYQLYIRRQGSWDWPVWVQNATSWLPEYEGAPYDLPAGQYTWWAQAWNEGAGYGDWSEGLEFVIPGDSPGASNPIAPTGTITETRPTFQWSEVSNATWYQLYIRRLGADGWDWSGIWLQAATSWVPEYQDAPYDVPVGEYEWWVQTWNEDGYGPRSEALTFAIADTDPPGNVGSLSAEAGDGRVHLTWTNPRDTDFAGVDVRRSTDPHGVGPLEGNLIYRGSNTGFTDKNVQNGTLYTYGAYSYDTSGNYAGGVTTSAAPEGVDEEGNGDGSPSELADYVELSISNGEPVLSFPRESGSTMHYTHYSNVQYDSQGQVSWYKLEVTFPGSGHRYSFTVDIIMRFLSGNAIRFSAWGTAFVGGQAILGVLHYP